VGLGLSKEEDQKGLPPDPPKVERTTVRLRELTNAVSQRSMAALAIYVHSPMASSFHWTLPSWNVPHHQLIRSTRMGVDIWNS
jgi:hypothetical protein